VKQEFQERPVLEQRLDSRCILIVDDETLIRELCSRALEDFRVEEAANGAEALAILQRQSVDVILTDVMMPDMDGLTLLQRAKELDPTQVVIMMTGFADKDVVLQALRENADDFLTKPLNLLQLKTTISKALDKKRLKEELVYLRRMDRLKSDFLGMVSHKLKTPVTAISLFLQNLAGDPQDLHDPEVQRHLTMIVEESRYLQRLIEDLLQHSEAMLQPLSGIDAPVPVGGVLKLLCSQFEQRAAGMALKFCCRIATPLPTLVLDEAGLRFSVSALLDNALKFSPAGGRVELVADADGEVLRIRVSDQGPGIPANEIPKIFEKFYQVDPDRTGQVRGFGLGLYFARQFVAFHRGTLTLAEAPGGGACATLSLPC